MEDGFRVGDVVRCAEDQWFLSVGDEREVRWVEGGKIGLHVDRTMSASFPASAFELVSRAKPSTGVAE